jgi:low affinity Fe/Cu permease
MTTTDLTRGSAQAGEMPSSVAPDLSFFDRFATGAATFVSRAWFFALCVLLILLWAPTYFVVDSLDTWQLIINTATTIVTFLLVALLQNTQRRSDEALQHKLNAIADGLADLMHAQAAKNPKLQRDIQELKAAVGLERRESS